MINSNFFKNGNQLAVGRHGEAMHNINDIDKDNSGSLDDYDKELLRRYGKKENSLWNNRYKIMDSMLTPKGVYQAQCMYYQCLKEYIQNKKVIIISSPLDRTIETAIYATEGYEFKVGDNVIVTQGLRSFDDNTSAQTSIDIHEILTKGIQLQKQGHVWTNWKTRTFRMVKNGDGRYTLDYTEEKNLSEEVQEVQNSSYTWNPMVTRKINLSNCHIETSEGNEIILTIVDTVNDKTFNFKAPILVEDQSETSWKEKKYNPWIQELQQFMHSLNVNTQSECFYGIVHTVNVEKKTCQIKEEDSEKVSSYPFERLIPNSLWFKSSEGNTEYPEKKNFHELKKKLHKLRHLRLGIDPSSNKIEIKGGKRTTSKTLKKRPTRRYNRRKLISTSKKF